MSENSHQPGIRVKKALVRGASIVATLAASLILVGVALADLEIPVLGSPVFVQTSGRLAALGIGDYRTNAIGDDLPHEIVVNVGCLPDAVIQFDLFDPEIYRESAAAPTIDEPRNAAQTTIADCRATAECDPATFTLLDPLGTPIATQTYNPSAATNEQWVTLATVTLPPAPVLGTHCGLYTLRSQTGDLTQPATLALNNDDNAWRFRLVGVNDGSGSAFPVENGPDVLPGTGDELWIGLQAVSYQHSSPASPSCQDFYWFADFGETNMFMLNFDMDGNTSVTYITPSGTNITGTVSSPTVWNDTAPQQQARPTFAQMDSFNPPGDVIGDAVASPETGLWDATICVNNENQYSMEVPNNTIFLTEPELPDVTIAKTDGVTTVSSPGTTTYTITLTNIGPGGAMPLPGAAPEVVDQLPADMSFTSCTVNPPLVGSCAENPAGSGTIEIQLQAQSGTVPAYLPGSSNAPDNTGTITVVADVDPGLLAGTSLTNTATVDFTDIYDNNHAPRSASDVDFVIGGDIADLSLDKTVDDNTPTIGQLITYTLTVTNIGPDDATGVEIADVLPGGVLFDSATPSQGGYSNITGIWTVGDILATNSASLQLQVTVNASGTISNYAQISAVDQIDPDSSPANDSTTEDDDDTAVITVGGPGGGGGGGRGGGGGDVDPAVDATPAPFAQFPLLLPETGFEPVENAAGLATRRRGVLPYLLVVGGAATLLALTVRRKRSP